VERVGVKVRRRSDAHMSLPRIDVLSGDAVADAKGLEKVPQGVKRESVTSSRWQFQLLQRFDEFVVEPPRVNPTSPQGMLSTGRRSEHVSLLGHRKRMQNRRQSRMDRRLPFGAALRLGAFAGSNVDPAAIEIDVLDPQMPAIRTPHAGEGEGC